MGRLWGWVEKAQRAVGAGASASAGASGGHGWCVVVQVCREFQRGTCKRAESECRFAHPPPPVSAHDDGCVTVCMDAVKGRCVRDPCRYFHPPLHLQAHLKAQARGAVCHQAARSRLARSRLRSYAWSRSPRRRFHSQSFVLISSRRLVRHASVALTLHFLFYFYSSHIISPYAEL